MSFLENNAESSFARIQINEVFKYPTQAKVILLAVEWKSTTGQSCDLEIAVYLYDERARFIEKLDCVTKFSADKSTSLEAGGSLGRTNKASYEEVVRIDLDKVDHSTAAILLFLDGGPRNFHFVQNVTIRCTYERKESDSVSFYQSNPGARLSPDLFDIFQRTRKDCQGVALCTVYKDGWNSDGTSIWAAKCFMEAIHVTSTREKDERCAAIIVEAVPALVKYKPPLFASVRALCAALSSQSLPNLKKKFLRGDGLAVDVFIDVVFKQLCETHPMILLELEAACAIAMLEEMFHQIDYNGDGSVDWDEFTTFCIQNVQSTSTAVVSAESILDQFVIEYREEVSQRDTTLNSFHPIAQMRHIPESKRLLVIPEGSENVMLFDDQFNLLSSISPSKVRGTTGSLSSMKDTGEASGFNSMETRPKVTVYDAVFLSGRDLYAYTASDHAITICKEQSSAGGRNMHYFIHNRLIHNLLQLKLCWSQRSRILCSVGTDRVIYGWDIDAEKPIFNVSRHEDIITDFHAFDELELFASCSLDKRIVLWNMYTRRVKGVLLGHKRGVRCLSYSSGILLSAGFECDAKAWDLVSKEVVLILRGHRRPICAAKMMCEKAVMDDELRAITVDDAGEFRVWNIFVKERSSEAQFAPTLQSFQMHSPEPALNRFRFMALPYDSSLSQGNYSNFIACSTKLMHFIPRKNSLEFCPPTCFLFHEYASAVVTAVGRSLLKYDLCSGHFISALSDISNSELTAISLDGVRGRRLYVGCNNGEILLVNFITGAIINRVDAHIAEVTCLVTLGGERNNIYSASLDGKIMMFEESSGEITMQRNSIQSFGAGVGVSKLIIREQQNVMIVSSSTTYWGLWNNLTLKRIMVFCEASTISDIEVIETSSLSNTSATLKKTNNQKRVKKILTIAVALSSSVRIYIVDAHDRHKTSLTYILKHNEPIYINSIALLNLPNSSAVNYHNSRQSELSKTSRVLIACTDDGRILIWDVSKIRAGSKKIYKNKFMWTAPSQSLSRPFTDIPATLTDKKSLSPSGSSKKIESKLPKLPFISAANSDVTSIFQTEVAEEFLSSDSSDDTASKHPMRSKRVSAYYSSSRDKFSFNTARETARSDSVTAANKVRSKGSNTVVNHQFSGEGVALTGRTTAVSKVTSPMVTGRYLEDNDTSTTIISTIDNDSMITSNTNANTNTNTNTDQLIVTYTTSLGNDDEVVNQQSICSWRGHSDSACDLLMMEEHSCFLTGSHDGFLRVWNIDKECLGELPLPNTTEKMRSFEYRVFNSPSWRFMLERKEVSQAHKDLALKLIAENLAGEDDHEELPNKMMTRRKAKNSVLLGADAVRADLRQNVLRNLSRPHSIPQDAPPNRISLLERSKSPGRNKQRNIIGGNTTNDTTTTTSPCATAIPLRREKSSNSFNSNVSSLASTTYNTMTKNNSITTNRAPTSSTSHTSSAIGNKSLFSQTSLWSSAADGSLASILVPPAAFSEASLSSAIKQGMLDDEAHRILLKIANEKDRINVYDRSTPILLLRSTAMSTSVLIPPLDDVATSEIHFGPQKEMYKNAEKYLTDKGPLSRKKVRDVLVMSRIRRNVRKIHKMIHVIPPPSHDEVLLPHNTEYALHASDEKDFDKNSSSQTFLSGSSDVMEDRLQASASLTSTNSTVTRRPLDRDQINSIIEKVQDATDNNIPEWEKRYLDASKKKVKNFGTGGRHYGQNSMQLKAILEKKLANAIKQVHREEDGLKVVRKVNVLPPRTVAPYYKLIDVKQFIDMFVKVDEDGSGELDQDEWVKFFTTLNRSMSVQQARMIFMECDKNNDGLLSLRDLIDINFEKASKEQQRSIFSYVDLEINKKRKSNLNAVSSPEMEQLFCCYDTNGLGFIPITLIRERIKAMTLLLPMNVSLQVSESFKDMEDDEMVNQTEFIRLFQPYTML